MGMEEDLQNAFKYANFSGKADPLQMMHKMLQSFEVVMLKRMQAQINSRLQILTHSEEGSQDVEFDPFVILGVNMNSTKDEVNNAYREKANEAHPDKGGTHEEMAKVNAAREAIYIFKGWKKEK